MIGLQSSEAFIDSLADKVRVIVEFAFPFGQHLDAELGREEDLGGW